MTTQLIGAAHRIPAWTIGDRLRKAREVASLEQADLARMLQVSRATVGNYEREITKPRRKVLAEWALATGVPVRWLETGSADGTPSPDGTPEHFPIAKGCSDLVTSASPQHVAVGVSSVLGVQIDIITVIMVGERVRHGGLEADQVMLAWAVLTAAGFDADASGIADASLPAYIDKDRLAEELRQAVWCAVRDSNPEPAD